MFKKLYVSLVVICVILGCMGTTWAAADSNVFLQGVSHINHSTIKITGEKTIYFDPLSIEDATKDADIIFITHTHGDHFSTADIEKLLKADTTVVVPSDGVDLAKKAGIKHIVKVEPNKSYKIKSIKFETVPAYNINKKFHPKENKWVGYIVTSNNIRYYAAGDTDVIPEMKKIKADVAFLPVGGTYTMDAAEAAKAANIIKPKIAVPIHFGSVVGKVEDAKKFVSLLNKSIQSFVMLDLLKNVENNAHASIKFKADKIIYFDPFKISKNTNDADLIFITHAHDDHLSLEDIKKVMKNTTKFIVTKDVSEQLKKAGITNITEVEQAKEYMIEGINFKTVPAYNIGKDFHKKEAGWVGYVVNINNTVYYIAGDTDVTKEMEQINADVAFLPVGGTYTMDAKEAIEAAKIIKPLTAVPVHFGTVVGTMEDAKAFAAGLPQNINGVILSK